MSSLLSRDLQLKRQRRDARKADAPERFLAVLTRYDGDGDGVSELKVTGRPGYVYAQQLPVDDAPPPVPVLCVERQPREGLRVWVERNYEGQWEVTHWWRGIVGQADYDWQPYLPLHGEDHTWPDRAPRPDAVTIYPRALSMLRAYPSPLGGLNVAVAPLRYILDGVVTVFTGDAGVDLTASKPAVGLARYVGVYLNLATNAIGTVNGATTIDADPVEPDSPTFPAGVIASAMVRLDGSQTAFIERDFVDLRAIIGDASTDADAPADAQFLVLALNATLTDERRFVPNTPLAATDGGAGGDYELDLPISALAEEATPAANDWLLLEQNAGGTFNKVQAGVLAALGWGLDIIRIDETNPQADYTGATALEDAFAAEADGTFFTLGGPAIYVATASPLPDTSFLHSYGSNDSLKVRGYAVGGVTYGLVMEGNGYLRGIYAEGVNALGGDVGGVRVPNNATAQVDHCISHANGSFTPTNGYALDIGTNAVVEVYGGKLLADSATNNYGARVGAGSLLYLWDMPVIDAATFFTGAGTIVGNFQDVSGDVWTINGAAGSERRINSFLQASDGAPDPALHATAAGYIQFDTKIVLDLINGMCEGRLTLVSGTPVTTADQLAKATVYFTPYKGNRIAVYDGTNWILKEFTEKSVAVPATTVTPFDVFIYDNAGTLTLETTNWTNDTTRATALVLQDGVYVKSGTPTRRYLGTGRTTGTNGQTEDSAANRFLWNYYNRVCKTLSVTEPNSHDYNTAAWRPWNNVQANADVGFVVGVLEELVSAIMHAELTIDAGDSVPYFGIGLNVTNNIVGIGCTMSPAGSYRLDTAIGGIFPAVGYNYLCGNEYSTAAGTAPTFVVMTLTANVNC